MQSPFGYGGSFEGEGGLSIFYGVLAVLELMIPIVAAALKIQEQTKSKKLAQALETVR